MARYSSLLIALFLTCSVFGLFQTKYKVQYLNKDVDELKHQLEQEKESIHILKAEWAYLNQPQRLRELADRHLSLGEVRISQIREFDKSLYIRHDENKHELNDVNIHKIKTQFKNKVKWNYKDKNMFVFHPGSKKLLISINAD